MKKNYLSISILSKLAFLLLAVACVSICKAQSVSVWSSESDATGVRVTHITVVGTYEDGTQAFARGYYNDGLIHDDSARIANGGVKLSETAVADNWKVFDVGDAMYSYAMTNSYNNINANCGTAVDYATESQGVNMGNFFDYETVAIIETGWNIICDWVSGFVSDLWEAFLELFE